METLDQHDFTPWDWAPIGTLVVLAATVFVVVRMGIWVWTYVTAPVPFNVDSLPHIPMIIVPAGHPLPVSLPAPPAVVTATARVVERALVVACGEPTQQLEVIGRTQTDSWLEPSGWEDSLVVDELGAWDPDAADWLEPATYLETIEHTASRLNWSVLSAAKQRELADSFRRQTIAAIDAVLTGSEHVPA